MQKILFNNIVIKVTSQTYLPAEDSYLIADNLEGVEGEEVLDMGTGCGILAIILSKKAKRVLAIDINPHAVSCANMNIALHRLEGKIEVRLGDLFNALKPREKFDLIVFNPPYLPDEAARTKDWLSKAWDGGPTGMRTIAAFLGRVEACLKKKGRVLFIQSSLSGVDPLSNLKQFGLSGVIKDTRSLSFETLYLIEAVLA
ncbi:MAG TPA: HemK2/MTQ2 family protein methyltransferase [Candidatus Bathyarchaeia archaeon]|nr:HemK2/MTQ2 family protein methyltransferase [Candidatus Bathyarchaeia archaeon]